MEGVLIDLVLCINGGGKQTIRTVRGCNGNKHVYKSI